MIYPTHQPGETRVVVGMSGGVDSSVTALLLLRAGYQVEGVFMQNWEDDAQCTTRQDYRDASGVAQRLGIRLSTVNFADRYWDGVFEHFLAEYSAGRTPNPDILCNREIKFRAFLDHALAQGADAIATGHYARIAPDALTDRVRLLRGLDPDKDQSYFLHALGQHALSHSLFPVGEMDKSKVRALAQEAGLQVHGKKDSTGICFIGERKFSAFLSEYLPAQPGEIVDESGRVLGQHNGLMFHTLGQRQGLGIGGLQGAGEAPWFVLDKYLDSNRLLVGQGHDHPHLLRTELIAHDLHWVAGEPPGTSFRCTARVRYRQADMPASITRLEDDRVRVLFDVAVRAITPGQSVVLYQGESCLGGGVIGDLPL